MSARERPRFLLDTHAFLWMATDPGRLGPGARERVEAVGSVLLLSLASIWEMAIKSSLGKLALPDPLDRFLEEQLDATRTTLLEVRLAHVLAVEALPFHHRDPFDRLLVAQASIEKLPLLTVDPVFDAYSVERIW